MAIQFQCPGCQQPIEVDDEYAGRSATCPYCRRVVTAPSGSTWVEPPAAARPSATAAVPGVPPPPPPPDWNAGRAGPAPWSPERSAAVQDVLRLSRARRLGNLSLLMAGLVVGGLILMIVVMWPHMPPELFEPGGSRNPAVQRELQERIEKLPSVMVLSCVTPLLTIAGLVLAIVSLTQSPATWQGWVGLVVCGAAGLCVCLGGALNAVT